LDLAIERVIKEGRAVADGVYRVRQVPSRIIKGTGHLAESVGHGDTAAGSIVTVEGVVAASVARNRKLTRQIEAVRGARPVRINCTE
jgi:hypothetical protein